MRIGLISDTHGLLRPEALAQLQGVDHIVHAGDIGEAAILDRLRALAPLTAVRGNNDVGSWANRLPESEVIVFGAVSLCVIHELAALDIDPRPAGVDVVVYGHSHQPQVESKNGVLFVNPGSAGPRRFCLPVSVGELVIQGREIAPRLVTLDVAPAARRT